MLLFVDTCYVEKSNFTRMYLNKSDWKKILLQQIYTVLEFYDDFQEIFQH
jgi:hypothetical protein